MPALLVSIRTVKVARTMGIDARRQFHYSPRPTDHRYTLGDVPSTRRTILCRGRWCSRGVCRCAIDEWREPIEIEICFFLSFIFIYLFTILFQWVQWQLSIWLRTHVQHRWSTHASSNLLRVELNNGFHSFYENACQLLWTFFWWKNSKNVCLAKTDRDNERNCFRWIPTINWHHRTMC